MQSCPGSIIRITRLSRSGVARTSTCGNSRLFLTLHRCSSCPTPQGSCWISSSNASLKKSSRTTSKTAKLFSSTMTGSSSKLLQSRLNKVHTLLWTLERPIHDHKAAMAAGAGAMVLPCAGARADDELPAIVENEQQLVMRLESR